MIDVFQRPVKSHFSEKQISDVKLRDPSKETAAVELTDKLPIHCLIIPPFLVRRCEATKQALNALLAIDTLTAITSIEELSFYIWVNRHAELLLPIAVDDFHLMRFRNIDPTLLDSLYRHFDRYEVKFANLTQTERETQLRAFTPFPEVPLRTEPIQRGVSYEAITAHHVIERVSTAKTIETPWSFQWIDSDVVAFLLKDNPPMTLHGMIDDLLYHLTGRFPFHQVARTRLFHRYVCSLTS